MEIITYSSPSELSNHLISLSKKVNRNCNSNNCLKKLTSLVKLVSIIVKLILIDNESTGYLSMEEKVSRMNWLTSSFKRIRTFSFTLMKRSEDGQSHFASDVISDLIDFIESRYPHNLAFVDFVRMFEELSSIPHVIGNEYIKVSCHNLLTLLKEIKYLHERARSIDDVNKVPTSQATGPFIDGYFITVVRVENKLNIIKSGYPRNVSYVDLPKKIIRNLRGMRIEQVNSIKNLDSLLHEAETQMSMYRSAHTQNEYQTIDRLCQNFQMMSQFCVSLRIEQYIENINSSYGFNERILKYLDEFALLVQHIHLNIITNPLFNKKIIYSLYGLNQAIELMELERIQSQVLSDKINVIKIWNVQLINIFMKSSCHPRGLLETQTLILQIRLPKDLQADEITENSQEAWITKFKENETIQDLISSCPYTDCSVCYTDLQDCLSSDNLAVLSGCQHLFCLDCIHRCIHETSSSE